MSSTNAVFSWHNWIYEGGTSFNALGAFEAEAPLTNLELPQLGKLAISTDVTTNQWIYTLGGLGASATHYRPVHVVALLNTNIVNLEEAGGTFPTGLGLQLTDNLGNVDLIDVPPVVVPSESNDFQSHLIYFVPTSGLNGDPNKCRFLTVTVSQVPGQGCECGTIDPWTGEYTQAPFQAGAVWAGPIWRPPNGVRFRSWTQSVLEERRGPTSLGRQRYPSVEPKQRSGQLELLLPESATLGLDPVLGSAQQLASWCGVSRPLLCIPTDKSADLIYASGLYGYLDEPVAWTHVDNATEDSKVKRYHAATLQMTEGL